MKKILLLQLLTVLIFSCYQVPVSDNGILSVIIDADAIKAAPERGDTEIKLRLFNYREFIADQNIFNRISYLSDFPETVPIGEQDIITVPVNSDTGRLNISGIPSQKTLNLLIEYYGEGNDNPYYLSYAGLSAPFTVKSGKAALVNVTMLETEKATLKVNKFTGDGYEFSGEDYISAYSPTDMELYINPDTPSPGYITFNREPNAKIINNETSVNDGQETTMIFMNKAVPGKKMQIIVSDRTEPERPDSYYGISEIFEVQPGKTAEIAVTYYYYPMIAD